MFFFSERLITNVNDILKTTDKKLKLTQFEEKFRKDLIGKWSAELETLWLSKNINNKLIEINELKHKYKHNANDKAWYSFWFYISPSFSHNIINPIF